MTHSHLTGSGTVRGMTEEDLKNYLDTRRQGWPYEEAYRVERLDGHRFVAKIGDELAGLSYAETDGGGEEAVMHMNLKSLECPQSKLKI